MFNRVLYLGYFLWLIGASYQVLANEETLVFVAEDLPPYHSLDSFGQPKGALVDVVNALREYMSHPIRIQIKPFARGYSQTEREPNIFMFSLLKTNQREDNFRWVGQIYRIEAFLVGLKGRDELYITSLDEAKKHVIGTIRGYYSQHFLQEAGFNPEFNLSLSVNYQQMWQMLLKKRIDYILTNNVALDIELASIKVKREQIEQYFALKNFPSNLYIATSKMTDESLVRKMAIGLDKVKQSGEYQQIIQRWGLSKNTD